MQTRHLEDFHPGETIELGSRSVDRDEIIEFARKYDPQPFHLSDEAAAKTHFGRLAASGWHTCAMTMAVLARYAVSHEQAGLGSPGIDELRWRRPVYPGDTLTVRGHLLEKTPSNARHLPLIREMPKSSFFSRLGEPIERHNMACPFLEQA